MMTLREKLLLVAETYCTLTGVSKARVSTVVFSGGKRLATIEAGGDVLTSRYESAVQWFSNNWPDGKAWPEGVVRPKGYVAEAAE